MLKMWTRLDHEKMVGEVLKFILTELVVIIVKSNAQFLKLKKVIDKRFSPNENSFRVKHRFAI